MNTKDTPEDRDRSFDIEDLLEAAYGAREGSLSTTERTDSILDRLRRTAGELPHIHLREVQEEPSIPVALPSAAGSKNPDRFGRYQLLGEIGRGGVGAIHRVHDGDLGRDLALKVLLECHRGNPDMTRRFVEEAQIAGQLQHPGIPPIHELGLFAPDRPYFTMKLIKGRTLAALLDERPRPSEGRQRFLGIFEKVCQTIAYANARGVIHRDLKPSNVMVGAFGEVQVMDWGLAKVLARSRGEARARPSAEHSEIRTIRSASTSTESVTGAVMGTPAYMPPEQARGQVDDLDERSDVFGLGAILCEILTGKPPYAGRDGDEVRHMASRGDLDDAHRRLGDSECDRELIALATRCLELEPRDRPTNAGVVADRIADYLASLEARAHRSELIAAEARVRAQVEVKARRLTIVLAGTALVGIALGAMLILRRHEESVRASQSVDRVLDEATSIWRQAAERADWEKALQTAQQAASLVTDLVDDRVRARAQRLVAEIQAEKVRAEERTLQDQKRSTFLRRLEEIRLEHADDPDWDLREPKYRDAFRDFGIDIDGSPESDTVAAIQATGLADRVAAALDDWAQSRRRVRGDDAEGWRLLARIAKLCDPDPLRGRLRDAFLNDETSELQLLARSREFMETAPPPTMSLLYTSLFAAGKREDAVSVCFRAWKRFKEDFWLNHDLANFRLHQPQPDYSGADRHALAAVAVRPRSPHALRDYALILRTIGELSVSAAAYEDAWRLDRTAVRPQEHGLSARIERDEFTRFQQVPFFGPPGDVAFDTENGDALYVVHDAKIRNGGGVYRVEKKDGAYTKSERVAALESASSLVLDGSGTLWVVCDGSAQNGAYLVAIEHPRDRAKRVLRKVIREFQTEKDDDPSILGTAPAGFKDAAVSPGDLLIGDGGVEAGYGRHAPGVYQLFSKAIYAYSPAHPEGDPSAYDIFLTPPSELEAYTRIHLKDFEFSQDGKELFALFEPGRIVRIGATGKVAGEIEIQGDLLFSATVAMAVDPHDGRIWLADDFRDQIWSIDPRSGHARLEISFFKEGEPRLDQQVEFPEASMRFSPDGARFIVSDRGSGGWLWVFERKTSGANHSPTARVVTDPPNRALVLRAGEARITLDGSPSDDGDDGEQGLGFRWAKVSGPQGDSVESPQESVTVVRFTRPGVYVYALTVNDGQSDNATHLAQVPIEVYSVSARLARDSPFRQHSVLPFFGRPADVAFDPANPDVFYAIQDDNIRLGGGIYRVVRHGRTFRKEDRVVKEGKLSSLVVTPDRELWFVQEHGNQERSYVMVTRNLDAKPPFSVEPVIWNFAGPADDDPFVLGLVPENLLGQKISPGDIVVGDRSLDSDLGSDGVPLTHDRALLSFSPSRPIRRPGAHDLFLITPKDLEAQGVRSLVDFDFDPGGQVVYALFEEGKILAIDPNGNVLRKIDLFLLALIRNPRWRGIAVDPRDGRLWILEGRTDRVFSFHPGPKGDPRLEIAFWRDDGRETMFPSPNLRFSPDAHRLVITEASNGGWLWVFERE